MTEAIAWLGGTTGHFEYISIQIKLHIHGQLTCVSNFNSSEGSDILRTNIYPKRQIALFDRAWNYLLPSYHVLAWKGQQWNAIREQVKYSVLYMQCFYHGSRETVCNVLATPWICGWGRGVTMATCGLIRRTVDVTNWNDVEGQGHSWSVW